MQEEDVPGFAANGVSSFGDGMANAEVEMNLKPQVIVFDIAFALLTIVSDCLVRVGHMTTIPYYHSFAFSVKVLQKGCSTVKILLRMVWASSLVYSSK